MSHLRILTGRVQGVPGRGRSLSWNVQVVSEKLSKTQGEACSARFCSAQPLTREIDFAALPRIHESWQAG